MNAFFLIFGLLLHSDIIPHGFAGNTLIGLESNQDFIRIEHISTRFFSGRKTEVATYKEKSEQWKTKLVQAVAYCDSEAYFELVFGCGAVGFSERIECSPLQLFYRLPDRAWVAAHELHDGDWLLCKNNQSVQLRSKKYVQQSIHLYIIEVKKHHTFVVGRQKILTHNMFIPIAATIGMSIPFDIIFSAGSFGCMFGPVSFCCSVAVAGVAAAVLYQCAKEKHTDFSLRCDDACGWGLTYLHKDDQKGISDAQAPGMPTENDGFIPKKNWDGKKVRNSKTGQVGWPDERGNVWVPTGVGPLAHRGPHWDVIDKKGKHRNVLPGGKIC